MRLWNHHLGLPPHSTKTKDFAAEETWAYLTKLAATNTEKLHEAFPGVFPHNSYKTWKTPTVKKEKDAAGGARKIKDDLHPGFVDDRLESMQQKRDAINRGGRDIKTWEVRSLRLVCFLVCLPLLYLVSIAPRAHPLTPSNSCSSAPLSSPLVIPSHSIPSRTTSTGS